MMIFDYTLEPGKVLLDKYIVDKLEPLVSVVTAFYNSGKYIEQTYRCVLNQTFPYFEWIIVNDGTTNDKDVELLERLAKADPRIKIFHKENGGISTARNLGIRVSKTDIIIPLDADDLIEPTYIECIYWALRCNPEASWAYTDSIGFHNQEYVWEKRFSSSVMRKENILTNSAGIRKNDLTAVGCYAELQKYYTEDWYLWLILLTQGKYPVHISQKGFWYRRTNCGDLSKISDSTGLTRDAQQIIAGIAVNVPNNIKAVEFNRVKTNEFKKPYKWEWSKRLKYKSEKTKVLLLIPHMEMGGADAFNLDIVSRIDKKRFEIGIITTVPAKGTWRQQFAEYTSEIFELPTFLSVDDWSAFIHYYLISRQINLVFITNSYYGYYLTPWLRKEFPKLAIIDYVHMEEWYWRAGGYARVSSAVGSVLEKTFVCNEHLRRTMIDCFGRKPEDVETLYIGVDEEYFDVHNKYNDTVKIQFGIKKGRPIVLFPCRITPQKRPFLMIEIAKETRKYIPNICFLVVGDGTQFSEVKRQIENERLKDTVYFAGRQNDVRPFYAISDITLLCSLKEGLALTTYESLAMGVPVISSDVGGQSELVDDNVGRLIPLLQKEKEDFDSRNFSEDEIKSYVDAIVGLLSDKTGYETVQQNCRLKIRDTFTKRVMISRLETEIDTVINDSDKRQKTADALELLGELAEDYLVIYNEYEAASVSYGRLNMISNSVKGVLTFKKSPLSVIRNLLNRADNVYVPAFLHDSGLGKLLKNSLTMAIFYFVFDRKLLKDKVKHKLSKKPVLLILLGYIYKSIRNAKNFILFKSQR